MDDEDRKMGMLIAAFDAEHERLKIAILALQKVGGQLSLDVRSAAQGAVSAALSGLNTDVQKARQTLIDIQRLSLWRAAWQHVMVAVVAIAIALLGVWWYVPPLSEITALRTERDQLQISIVDLNNHGARMKHTLCGAAGDTKRFCVLIPKKPLMWDNPENRTEAYVVPAGYLGSDQ